MIEGKLVNLRAPEMDDLERNYTWINDREVTRYLAARYPMSLAAEETWMRETATRAMSYQHTFFAIETKERRHIGNTNYFNISPESRSAEIGIMIGDKDHWSKGYGADALICLLRFGFEEMNLHRAALNVYAPNARAIACYRKVGFLDEACMRSAVYQEGAYHDILWLSMLEDEFYAKHGRTEEAS